MKRCYYYKYFSFLWFLALFGCYGIAYQPDLSSENKTDSKPISSNVSSSTFSKEPWPKSISNDSQNRSESKLYSNEDCDSFDLSGAINESLIESFKTKELFKEFEKTGWDTSQYDDVIKKLEKEGIKSSFYHLSRSTLVRHGDLLQKEFVYLIKSIKPYLNNDEIVNIENVRLITPLFFLYDFLFTFIDDRQKYIAFSAGLSVILEEISYAYTYSIGFNNDLNAFHEYLNHICEIYRHNISTAEPKRLKAFYEFINYSPNDWKSFVYEKDGFLQLHKSRYQQFLNFIILHEIAHHALNHSNILQNISCHKKIKIKIKCEEEADRWAVKNMMKASLGDPTEILPLLIYYNYLSRLSPVSNSDHHNAQDRLRIILDEFKETDLELDGWKPSNNEDIQKIYNQFSKHLN